MIQQVMRSSLLKMIPSFGSPPELDDSRAWSSIVSGEEQVEEEELKGEVKDDGGLLSRGGGREEELKGEVKDETEWPSIAGGEEKAEEKS